MKNSSGKLKVILAILIVVVAVIIVFYRVANQKKADEGMVKLTATQDALLRNMEANYPPTPKEVVKYYAELSQCMYASETKEEEIQQLAAKSRELLDEELVAQQTDEQYYVALKTTIDSFKKEKRRIVSFTIPTNASQVEYYKSSDGDEMASLYCVFTLEKGGSLYYSDNEQYILRKDSKGYWKILGWQPVTKNEDNEQ